MEPVAGLAFPARAHAWQHRRAMSCCLCHLTTNPCPLTCLCCSALALLTYIFLFLLLCTHCCSPAAIIDCSLPLDWRPSCLPSRQTRHCIRAATISFPLIKCKPRHCAASVPSTLSPPAPLQAIRLQITQRSVYLA